MLTAAQLATYHRDGFVACPGFFNAAEVAVMQAEVRRLQEVGLLRNVATEGDGKTTSTKAFNLQICPLSDKSEVLRSLPFAGKVTAQIHTILASDFYLRLDQIFLKPARHGAGTGWHQDNAYFRDGSDERAVRGVGLWIAVHDATVANGTMHMIPRTFTRSADHQRDPSSDHHITMRVDESQAVPVEMAAGGALFFNWGVPHCTKGNTTERERAGLALHFQDLALKPADLDTYDTAPHPVLRGAGADGGQALYGADQRGRWEALTGTRAAVA